VPVEPARLEGERAAGYGPFGAVLRHGETAACDGVSMSLATKVVVHGGDRDGRDSHGYIHCMPYGKV
jgi:hypothetical protein